MQFFLYYDKIVKILIERLYDLKKAKSLKKVIISSAIITVVALVAAGLIAFGVLSFVFPRTLAETCKDMGNYPLAIKYYSLSYTYTGDFNDLLSCVHISIETGNDEDTVYYIEKFMEHDDYPAYCEETGNEQTIYANLMRAKYRTGDKQGALEVMRKAMEGVTDYPPANALSAMILEARKAKDVETAKILMEEWKKYTPTAEQTKSYNSAREVLNSVINPGSIRPN